MNFMTPTTREGNSGVKSVKFMYFLKNLLLYSGACSRQNKCIVMITNEGSTQIVNFMTPGARVLMLGCGHISHIVNIFHSFNIQHIDCYCVKGL